jgi:hypothetical protein
MALGWSEAHCTPAESLLLDVVGGCSALHVDP